MLKSKFGVWAIIIAIALTIHFGPKMFNALSKAMENHREDMTIGIDIQEENNALKNSVSDLEKYTVDDTLRLNFKPVNNMPSNPTSEVIIKRASDEEIEGYTKAPNQLYTAMVSYTSYKKLDDATTFSQIKTYSNTYPAFQKNMAIVFDAAKDNKTWSDIGEKNFKGNVKIYIPSKRTGYYDDAINYILSNIYNTPTTNSNLEERTEKLNAILAKCYEVDDLDMFISNYDNFKDGQILIAPEYFAFVNNAYGEESSETIIPIYSTNQPIIKMDVFVKNVSTRTLTKQDNKEIKFDSLDTFIKYIENDSAFLFETGLRPISINYSFEKTGHNYSVHFILETFNVVDCVYLEPTDEVVDKKSVVDTKDNKQSTSEDTNEEVSSEETQEEGTLEEETTIQE